ncbi:golgin subfamily A member 1 isoform X2 [Brienomyrus brachyistius]|uniref:golgin subfamily A member 1 isoform X2 n=1 Tax=Brienomyrus brachyistius TaxID=42636 RepID=UPI0020B2CCF0|nr:golgin subfamily A member 1 isoform X2 [Brienomyrus brachyistius]
MFAKLKKKIAEEAATAPRSAGRIPRSVSKESITSAGADSGDDFASDGSSSRDDLSSQLLRRNGQIRRLEAKLSDYAEQLRVLQKTKEKLEIALEKHQDSSMRKLQEQNESYQASRAKMAEGMALALAKKDQEWKEKIAALEKWNVCRGDALGLTSPSPCPSSHPCGPQEKGELSTQLGDLTEQSLSLFRKRDDLDELEGFQQQELAKLLRKEEQLGQREEELRQQSGDLQEARRVLAEAQDRVHLLEEEQQENLRLNQELQAEREKFLGLREEAEKKISELEGRSEELQDALQRVTEDFQKSLSSAEQALSSTQADHQALKLQHEQHKQKVAVAEEEKDRLVWDLQGKVCSLERRLQGNLTEDEHLEELLKEKGALEQKVEETRAELLEARTSHATALSTLEAQISRLNGSLAELQVLLGTKDDSLRSLRESSEAQINALERQVHEYQEMLKSNEQQESEREAHMQKLQAEWSLTSERLRQKDQEALVRLGAQVAALETARDVDRAATQHRITEMELEQEVLLRGRAEVEAELSRQANDLELARAELVSQQAVSVEIVKALEVMRTQKEELQQQVGETESTLKAKEDELTRVTEQLVQREAELHALQEELRAAGATMEELRAEVELQRRWAEEREAQLGVLQQEALAQNQQGEVETLLEQSHAPAVCQVEQNGVVTVDDLELVQRSNRELEQQLSEKTKTIKQLQQRLAELKRTLQKELKLKPDAEPEGKEKRQEAKADRPERSERPSPEASARVPSGSAPPPGTTISTSSTVTNNANLSNAHEINFEYLKHVVLKFMSSREAEAYQLIRAVSVLLHFTREEEAMLKESLEYKMSWFGSKPSPRGIVRPSISGSSAHWS